MEKRGILWDHPMILLYEWGFVKEVVAMNQTLKDYARYASLNVLGMIGLSCYILADTFFVSLGMGANGLTALNLAIPVYNFINGAGLMIGMGGGTKYSIAQSQKDGKTANQVFTHAAMLTISVAMIFFLVGVFGTETLVRALGADAQVFDMSRTYLRVLLMFAPMFMMNNLLLCFVRNDGSPQLSMAAMITGSLSNVVLDYVFIFPMGMGIFGAAFATGLAPIISMGVLSTFFIKKKNHFKLTRCRIRLGRLWGILSNGVPSFVTEASSGIVMIVFNQIILGLEGNTGVAAYGVIANLSLVVVAIYTGISQGIQPILSRNYGMGNRKSVSDILRYAMLTMLAISAVVYGVVFFGADQIAAIFNSEGDAALQAIAVKGLKYYFTAVAFAGFNIILSVYYTSTEYVRPAYVISLLRGFILIIPMAFTLSRLFGITGVWCAFPATEGLVALIGLGIYVYSAERKRKIKNKSRQTLV